MIYVLFEQALKLLGHLLSLVKLRLTNPARLQKFLYFFLRVYALHSLSELLELMKHISSAIPRPVAAIQNIKKRVRHNITHPFQ